MAFHTAEYDACVFLGDPTCRPLWHWSQWQHLMPELDSLIRAARGTAAVRSTQYLPNRAGTVKFGRIGWKERDQQKWTHGSPTSFSASEAWLFICAELWAPSWTQCERDKSAPDVFLSIYSRTAISPDPAFDPVVVLAVVSELAEREPRSVSRVVAKLIELTQPKLAVHQRRPWGRSAPGSTAFSYSLQDLHVTGLLKPGQPPDKPIDLDLFVEQWQPLSESPLSP